ncbi:hypothetical protein LEP1GSC166_3256 [Leptospira kirschneri]|nr:hypothetical protein LEP1GSC166_3256 [Leptospira kirschneri]
MKNIKRTKLKGLEKRRLKGIQFLKQGCTCYRVGKELGVSKQNW